ncbi:hypothetical protein ACJMK2_001968 [Sinanodonta woodiana]|uniref:Protein unc-45 homolog B n=1 Tax=Sinanodonta woodiana TaxID=1069815 RepID=A0ABD3XUG2_SINWO
MEDAVGLKEEGNTFFKDGKYEEALSSYIKAMEVSDLKDAEKAILYKNMAQCHLKQKSYEEAIKAASKALELFSNDPKALYRRCQAYEQLGQIEEAYKDAAAMLKADPKNTAVKSVIERLTPIIQERAKQQNSTQSRVSQMFNIAFDPNGAVDKRIQAMNNLLVLTREEAGSKIIIQQNGIASLRDILDQSKNDELIQPAARVLAGLCEGNKDRAFSVFGEIGMGRFRYLMSKHSEGVATSVGHIIQNILTRVSDVETYKEEIRKFEEARKKGDNMLRPQFKLTEAAEHLIDEVFHVLIVMLESNKVSGYGRDSAMELIIKNVTRKDGLHWTRKFLDTQGIEALLLIAGAVKQHQTLQITDLSKMHASVALSKIWDDTISDKERDIFKEKCSAFFKELFGDANLDSKVEAVKAISTLLQGPFEVGNMILGFEGVTQLMLALANSDISIHQQVAVEAIVHSASKKERCTGLLADAVPILKKLFQSGDDHVKVRALVGLCKLGSYGGSDASIRPMAEGSTVSLAKACRKFLKSPNKEADLKQWGTEGLAYLSLDADVKEDLITDEEALKSLVFVAMNPTKSTVYATATVFVNLTNSYDKQELVPEMVELAKFSKQHVPEEHEMDKPDYVKKRVHKLAATGIVSALVALSNTESGNSRELVSRVFLTLAVEEDLRGLIVQQGGVKVLLSLALDKNTDNGKHIAAQALAKIAITLDPNLAFPGQRIYEVVRPLIQLLHIERTGLQNFEGLLALTNLSSISDSVRQHIVTDKGIPMIEHYMYEEHEMIRRAATECMCNMVMNEEVEKLFEGENERVKLWTLYCGEEDQLLVRAAAGGLAILTSNLSICRKVIQVNQWYEIMLSLIATENPEIMHRGCYILKNLIYAEKEIAEKVLEGQLMEALMAVSILTEKTKESAAQCAKEALEKAVEYGFIKHANKSLESISE